MKNIYLDNAATTAVDKSVFESMKPFFKIKYGNASEYHKLGREAKKAIEKARANIASFFGARDNEIFFTSCATESINLAHKGLIESLTRQDYKEKAHIITSSIEHKAVLETCKHLENLDLASITYLPVDSIGRVDVGKIERAIKKDTRLVSIMYVNNEVGTIEPVKEISILLEKINKKRVGNKIYFHTDATQAINYLDCKVNSLGVDLLSFTGHKIYAPKGIGVLYIREGIPINRQTDGGGQESNLRAGTENVASIVGLGKAIELVKKNRSIEVKKIRSFRDKLIKAVLRIDGVSLTGDPKNRAPHIASFLFDRAEGETVVLRLSNLGIYASSGSACASDGLLPSHVLTAMNIPAEKTHGSVRFSLGKGNKESDINYLIMKLPSVIEEIRKMSPNY